jgi:hypothetical protein
VNPDHDRWVRRRSAIASRDGVVFRVGLCALIVGIVGAIPAFALAQEEQTRFGQKPSHTLVTVAGVVRASETLILLSGAVLLTVSWIYRSRELRAQAAVKDARMSDPGFMTQLQAAPSGMVPRFNPPPGWPAPPTHDWLPEAGWAPDPTWPPTPVGWQFIAHVPEDLG